MVQNFRFFWPDSGFENLIKGVGIYVTFAK